MNDGDFLFFSLGGQVTSYIIREETMESVYKVIEIIGSSTTSWEDAAKTAIERAGESVKELRVAEVKDLDMAIEGGKYVYRTKLRVSFKLKE